MELSFGLGGQDEASPAFQHKMRKVFLHFVEKIGSPQ
jgi:hypothetical protein